MMLQVKVNMTDDFTNEKVSRIIDGTNICLDNGECWEIAECEKQQRKLLNEWIRERGNDQHSTSLTLNSFELLWK